MALYAAAVGVLLYFCLAPTDKVPGAGLFWDKSEHAAAWFVLSILGFTLAPRRPRAICLFALALGGAVELTQATMGFGRQGDWRDLVADSLGVGLAIVAALVSRRLRR